MQRWVRNGVCFARPSPRPLLNCVPPAVAFARGRPFSTQPEPVDPSKLTETFLSGTSAAYLEDLYLDWLDDPSSVNPSWAAYFRGLSAGAPPGAAHCAPGDSMVPSTGSAELEEILSVQAMVRSYQVSGHRTANLDPLGIRQVRCVQGTRIAWATHVPAWSNKCLCFQCRLICRTINLLALT